MKGHPSVKNKQDNHWLEGLQEGEGGRGYREKHRVIRCVCGLLWIPSTPRCLHTGGASFPMQAFG